MSNYDSYGTPKKPDNNCRTCTDFKFWSKQQRQIFHKATSHLNLQPYTEGLQLTIELKILPPNLDDESDSSKSSNGGPKSRGDCPMDKVSLGKATWGLLHTMAAFYEENPTDTQKKDMKTFFDVLSRVYPCEHCAKDFRKDLKENPVNVNSQFEFSKWLCNFHNRVNTKLGKPTFDCAKINQRWRDGWLDGSCD